MKSIRKIKDKILTPQQAEKLCLKLRKKNKKIIFTNGCFDILHPGHIKYLEKARSKGDFFIVALDTDESVRALKGSDRPVNNLRSRQEVMAALECIDAVTYFENSNPLPIIHKVKPHILVKGGDWKIKDIIGSKEVLGWGGKVFSIAYIKGKSTTNIINKIRSL